MKRVSLLITLAVTLGMLATARDVHAQVRRSGAVGPGGTISLPYPVSDNAGNQWFIYQNGWLQQQGNNQVYGQGAMLQINGNQPSSRNNQARLDEKTGEIIFENMTSQQGLQITRRILPMREQGAMRYVDVIKNPTGNEVPVNLSIQSNINYGVQSADMIPDTRRKGQNLAWVAQTGNNRTAVEVFSGRGTKQPMTINWQQGNNTVNASLQTTVPANSEIAIRVSRKRMSGGAR